MNRFEISIIAFLLVLVMPLSFLTTEWVAVCLIYISFAVIWLNKDIRKDWRLLGIVLLTLSSRELASIINVYYATLQGADMDAIKFQDTAVSMAHSIQPSWYGEFGGLEMATNMYARFLSLFYRAFGDSLLLGQGLSILAYAITCLLVVKLAKELRLSKWSTGLVVLLGFLPSTIIFTSITMREPYQMLFFLMVLYFAIGVRKKPTLLKMTLLVISGVVLAYLHNGLILYAVFLVCLSIFWGLGFSIRQWKRNSLGRQLIGFALLIGVLFAWISFASNFGGVSRAILTGEGADYVGVYRDKTTGSFDRATYGIKLDTTSITAFVPSAILVFTFYMFAPFPWQINSLVDVYAAGEGVLRLLLIYHSLAIWYRIRGERRSQWGYMLVAYFSIEFLWAAGTANWGTAIRHHVVAYPILIILCGAGLIRSVLRIGRFPGKRNVARLHGIKTRSAMVNVSHRKSFPL
jgi:hypothetical protein